MINWACAMSWVIANNSSLCEGTPCAACIELLSCPRECSLAACHGCACKRPRSATSAKLVQAIGVHWHAAVSRERVLYCAVWRDVRNSTPTKTGSDISIYALLSQTERYAAVPLQAHCAAPVNDGIHRGVGCPSCAARDASGELRRQKSQYLQMLAAAYSN